MTGIKSTFAVQESIVSALPTARDLTSTSQERYRAWAKWRKRSLPHRRYTPEFLVPRIVRNVYREWPPPFMVECGDLDLPRAELKAQIEELGPWRVPFQFDYGLATMRSRFRAPVSRDRILFRRELINGTVAALLGDELSNMTVLDIGCNCGFFSLDIATRGAKHVYGIDLRPENIAQAKFLADYYGIGNVTFAVSDADDLQLDQQWDIVLNLGVLYHVTNPLQFIRQTYDLCRRFAVIDTNTHTEPVSAFFLMGDKDVNKPTEGREFAEFHPTYRAAIDAIRFAGFSEITECVGEADPEHELYANGSRRCFLAVK
jgi:tRNA (mo5U34)-methyltransferase